MGKVSNEKNDGLIHGEGGGWGLYSEVYGTYLTTQFPSHGLGESVAYGFQTIAKGSAL